jgi:probable rRNA maturation factor
MRKIDLDISWEIEEDKEIEEQIKNVVKNALENEGAVCDINLSVVVTDNENIQEINKSERNIDSPTDVLSFPGHEKEEWEELKLSEDNLVYIGDIVVSKEKIIEQAKEYETGFEREFCYLIAHGMLHLMGYDHMNDDEKSVMREKEEEIMKKLNLERK